MPTAGYELQFADDALKTDREVVLAAVRWGAYAFGFAHTSLRSDPAFCLEALEINGDVLKYVDPTLLETSEFLQSAAQVAPQALSLIAAIGLDLKETPIELVRRFGLKGLARADSSKDKEAVIEAARRFGMPALDLADSALKLDWDVVLPAVARALIEGRLRHFTRLPAAFSGAVPVALDIAFLIDTSRVMRSRVGAIKTAVSMLIDAINSGDPNKDGYEVGGAYNVVASWRAKVLGFHFGETDARVVLQPYPFAEGGSHVLQDLDSLSLTGSAAPERPISEALMHVCQLPTAQQGVSPDAHSWRHDADAARLIIVMSDGQDRQTSSLWSDVDLLSALDMSKMLLTIVAPECDENLSFLQLYGSDWYPVERA
jgi:hypothetical protein